MYYGWINSITITGIVTYTPHTFTAKNGKNMIVFMVYVPRYNYLPLREGDVREPIPPLAINIIGGESILKLMNKRKVVKGDIVSVTGSLISFDTAKQGIKITSYFIEPQNVLVLKGYRGMKAIIAEEATQAIYNDLLKEVKVIYDTDDNSGSD